MSAAIATANLAIWSADSRPVPAPAGAPPPAASPGVLEMSPKPIMSSLRVSSMLKASSRSRPIGSLLSLDQYCSSRKAMGSLSSSRPSSSRLSCTCWWIRPSLARAFRRAGSRLIAPKRRRNLAEASLKCFSSLCVSTTLLVCGRGVVMPLVAPSAARMPRNARFPTTSTRLELLRSEDSAFMPLQNASQRFVCLCISRSCVSLGTTSCSRVNSVARIFFGSLRRMSDLLIT
mmetsp:Transcript_107606/g.304208  ORF Transcript_107606/g.304208 Transcript_107606/m.304208 type:complete len:232 (-) Transcript_107606:1503-2198(-)